eukprot:gene10925-12086_t
MAVEEKKQMAYVKQLIAKKDSIEKEIISFQEVLQLQNVGMDDALVDKDGFPRADIDVHGIRIARNKIICLQNDLNAIMKQIEEGIHKAHAMARENKTTKNDEQMDTTDDDMCLKPFLKVDLVSQSSPAERAGLQVNDLILKFGTIKEDNFLGLQSIGSLVQHSKGNPLPIIIQRQEKTRCLTLTPNTWSGKGLLGYAN